MKKPAVTEDQTQYIQRVVKASGCLEVIVQHSEHWQSKSEPLGSILGDCWLCTFRIRSEILQYQCKANAVYNMHCNIFSFIRKGYILSIGYFPTQI